MDFSRESAMTFDNEMFAEVLNVSDSKLFMNEFKDRVRSILIWEEELVNRLEYVLKSRGEMVFSRT